MKKTKCFMVVHRDPDISWDEVEENWTKMVNLEDATWLRTYYNKEENVRFCLWLAPDAAVLEKIFADFQVRWVSILAVEETIPDIWAKLYRMQTEAEERLDTTTSSEMLAREGAL